MPSAPVQLGGRTAPADGGQLYPHQTTSRRLDGAAGTALARRCDLLLAHDRSTARRVRDEFGVRAESVEIVPHASYVGAYPAGRTREKLRSGRGVHYARRRAAAHVRAEPRRESVLGR